MPPSPQVLRIGLGLVSLLVATAVAGCGGSSSPPRAPVAAPACSIDPDRRLPAGDGARAPGGRLLLVGDFDSRRLRAVALSALC